MKWHSQGIVISAQPHGEGHLVLGVFTQGYGFHKGYVFGGSGSKKRSLLELGNLVDVQWSSRFEDQLGTYRTELVKQYGATLFANKSRLTALGVICYFLTFLPQREPHDRLYLQTISLLEILQYSRNWYVSFIAWELALLEALGFGLDLGKCAVTGSITKLAFVSPKTGCVVTAKEGVPYESRLLKLPHFLSDASQPTDLEVSDWQELKTGFDLTSFFLEKVFRQYFKEGLPSIRMRMMDYIEAECSHCTD